MKVYINSQHKICAIHYTTDPNLTELTIPDNVFSTEFTEELIKCYACQVDDQGNYAVQLLVPPDMAEQINQIGLQRIANQKLMESQLETIVSNDYRLSALELKL